MLVCSMFAVISLRNPSTLTFVSWLWYPDVTHRLRGARRSQRSILLQFGTSKSQIPLRYLLRSWFEAGRRPVRTR